MKPEGSLITLNPQESKEVCIQISESTTYKMFSKKNLFKRTNRFSFLTCENHCQAPCQTPDTLSAVPPAHSVAAPQLPDQFQPHVLAEPENTQNITQSFIYILRTSGGDNTPKCNDFFTILLSQMKSGLRSGGWGASRLCSATSSCLRLSTNDRRQPLLHT